MPRRKPTADPGQRTAVAPSPPPPPLIEGAVEQLGDDPRDGKIITPLGLETAETMAALGRSNISIAAAFGVAKSTFQRMLERQPDLAERIAVGRGKLEDELVDGFLAQFRKGNTVAGIFLAKARLGWREGEARDGGGTKVAVQINLPDALTLEAYIKGVKGREVVSVSE